MIIQGTKSALAPGLTASFLASQGTAPYAYSVDTLGPDTQVGTIDPMTGVYTAPPTVRNRTPFFDTIRAIDADGTNVTAMIIIGTPWMLLLEIIQRVLNLDKQMIWMENQKFFEPKNAMLGMWVVLMFPSLKTWASGIHPAGPENSWEQTEKWGNFSGPVDIHIYSRDLSALNRKEEVVLALTGPYSRFQQQANSFFIARLPHNIVDLSVQDGDAIPWHFVLSVEMQYGVAKTIPSETFDTFGKPQIIENK